jgi:hypothetical protein
MDKQAQGEHNRGRLQKSSGSRRTAVALPPSHVPGFPEKFELAWSGKAFLLYLTFDLERKQLAYRYWEFSGQAVLLKPGIGALARRPPRPGDPDGARVLRPISTTSSRTSVYSVNLAHRLGRSSFVPDPILGPM